MNTDVTPEFFNLEVQIEKAFDDYDYTLAVRLIDEALFIAPGSYKLHYDRGYALFMIAGKEIGLEKLDLFKDSEKSLLESIKLKNNFPSSFFYLGLLKYEVSQIQTAEEYHLTINEAVSYLNTYCKYEPFDPMGLTYYALLLDHSAYLAPTEEAERILKEEFSILHRAYEIDPDYTFLLFVYGSYYLTIAELNISKTREPDILKGIEFYDKYLISKHDDISALLNSGRLNYLYYISTGDASAKAFLLESKLKFEKVLEYNPEDSLALNYLAHTYYDIALLAPERDYIEYLQESLDVINFAIKINPDSEGNFSIKGYVLEQLAKEYQGDAKVDLALQSLNCYETALHLNPDNYKNAYNKANVKYLINKINPKLFTISECIKDYSLALQVNPEGIEAYTAIVICYIDMANKTNDAEVKIDCYRSAIKYSEEAFAYTSDYEKLLVSYGQALTLLAFYLPQDFSDERLFHYKSAIEVLEKLYQSDNKNSQVYSNLASCYYQLSLSKSDEENNQYFQKAIAVAERAIDFFPNDCNSHSDLAFYLYEYAINLLQKNRIEFLQRSINYYEESLKLNPEQDFIFQRIGLCYLYIGNYSPDNQKTDNYLKALDYFKKAEPIDPVQDKLAYNFACIYSLLGCQKEFYFYLEKAFSMDSRWKDFAKNDSDFERFANDAEFIAMINS